MVWEINMITYSKQVVVDLLGIQVIFALHAHKEILDVHDGAQQLVDLFVGDVGQMGYVTLCAGAAIRFNRTERGLQMGLST